MSSNYNIDTNLILVGDAKKNMKRLPDKSIQCIVTSPPYYGLRDYGHKEQIGLELSPEQYIKKLVSVFREAYRVLKDDGTLWINIGDSYAGSGKGAATHASEKHWKQLTNKGALDKTIRHYKSAIHKKKDLIGIPWMLAFALKKDGWYLRQDIIWSKKNPMPESVTDRCSRSHEYLFLLSKKPKYYFNHKAIKQPLSEASVSRLNQDIDNQNGSFRAVDKTNGTTKAVGGSKHKNMQLDKVHTIHRTRNNNGHEFVPDDMKANKKSVWTTSTAHTTDNHFAVFPEELIVDCIRAGSKVGDVVLDMFAGTGTTGVVAGKLDRRYVLIELNPNNAVLCDKKLTQHLGLFK